MQYDVFNGDADGICALHQLRLADPAPEAVLVTGVKRDIALLSRITELTACSITVLDISLDSNRAALERLLQAGNTVRYIDHHYAGVIPEDANLSASIDYSPDRCTSLIVNALLNGRFSKWGICGAFGDNLHDAAGKIGSSLSLSGDDMAKLREVGNSSTITAMEPRWRTCISIPPASIVLWINLRILWISMPYPTCCRPCETDSTRICRKPLP